MALRALWGFDHLPQGVNVGAAATAFGLAYSGYGITLLQSTSPNVYVNGGYITGGYAGSGSVPLLTIASNSVQSKGTRGSWMGFRATRSAAATGSPGVFIYYNNVGLINVTDASLTTSMGDFWIDLYFDRANTQILVYVNGVLKYTNNSNSNAALVANNNIQIGKIAGLDLKDFYFLDDTQDSTLCARLPAFKNKLLHFGSLVPNDWVSSDGTTPLETVLNAAATTTATLTAPNAVSQSTQNTLQATLSATFGSTDTIMAVDMFLTGARSSATATDNLGVTIAQTGTYVRPTMIFAAQNTFEYSKPMGLFEKTLDGNTWTQANLAATKITFTPAATIPNTVALVHFSAAPSGQNFTDDAGHPIYTAANTAVYGTAPGALFSSTNAYVPGGSASYCYLPDSPDFNMGNVYTIEGWFWSTNAAQDSLLVDRSPNGSSAVGVRAWIELNAGKMQVKYDGDGSVTVYSASTAGSGAWVHWAICSNGTAKTIWLNGVSAGTATTSSTWGNTTGIVALGNNTRANGSQFQGYMREFRFSRIVRYTGPFTPPTGPFVLD